MSTSGTSFNGMEEVALAFSGDASTLAALLQCFSLMPVNESATLTVTKRGREMLFAFSAGEKSPVSWVTPTRSNWSVIFGETWGPRFAKLCLPLLEDGSERKRGASSKKTPRSAGRRDR